MLHKILDLQHNFLLISICCAAFTHQKVAHTPRVLKAKEKIRLFRN